MGGENDARKSPSSPPRATNGSSASPLHKAAVTNARNGTSNGKSESNGTHTNGSTATTVRSADLTFFGHDREAVARILIQGLSDLGYDSAAGALSAESGYDVETPYASAFRVAIIQGDWPEAEALLEGTYPCEDGEGVALMRPERKEEQGSSIARQSSTLRRPHGGGLALAEEAPKDEMLFLIRRQKYLELLEMRDLGAALMVLRQELQPLHQDERQLHALSSLIMCQTSEDLRYQASWDGALGTSRELLLADLSRAISPSAMIPEHRLARIFSQWKGTQILNCPYHNTAEWPSLYMDHICERDHFPLETVCELEGHQSEVWFLQFSHDGTRLATASKDSNVIIYETTAFKPLHVLQDHRDAVAYLAWSPDDSKLVTCSQDKEARLWDTRSGACLRTMKQHGEPVTTAAWATDGQTLVTGSLDLKAPLCIWSLEVPSPNCPPIFNFRDQCSRVQDCAFSTMTSSLMQPDASYTHASSMSLTPTTTLTRLIAVCTDRTIDIFDYARREKLSHVAMDHDITCLSIARDGHEMLVNLSCDEIWAMRVWDCEVVQKFRGQKQGHFVIRNCLGGAREGFVVSGGEDSKIYIWHRNSGRLIEQLDAHRSGCVNAVAWNMAKPGMWASAGDDCKVRVWSNPLSSLQGLQLQATRAALSPRSRSVSQEHSQSPPSWGSSGERPRSGPGTGSSGSHGVHGSAAVTRR